MVGGSNRRREMEKKAIEKVSDQEEASTKSSNIMNMYPFVTPVRGTIKRRIFACFLRNLKLACRRVFHSSRDDLNSMYSLN
ncbi:unnamed protein product [Ilex paraguariensis]|uniref:Uncharacterized protein n=1 Tax=Ilex paraguariensis TaxID=185542 RepID=A0ABC8V155_9AQUA